MWFGQRMKMGKVIGCWLLLFVLVMGKSLPLVYAQETETSGEQRAFGDIIEVDRILYKIHYGYSEVNKDQTSICTETGDIVIPDKVTDGKEVYPVTRIAKYAFLDCVMRSVVLPDSIVVIEYSAFANCKNLEEIKLSENLQTIEQSAFRNNKLLKKVVIPDSVISIEKLAFDNCESLEELKLSANISSIGFKAFSGSAIKTVEVPNSITIMEGAEFAVSEQLEIAKIPDHIVINNTFWSCDSLKTLQIKVSLKEGNVVIPIQNISTLDNYGFGGHDMDVIKKLNRKLEFWTEDGSAKLTGDALIAAQKAYMAVEDGDTGDNLWYGFEVVPAYEVTPVVNKDGKIWADHDRIFKLTKDNGSSFIDNFTAVLDGTYQIYDFTDNTDGMDTGVTVYVNGSDVTSAPIEYYTVTFYDGADNPYTTDTDQKPQIVLKGTYAAVPAKPEKTGYRFNGWKKDADGQTSFDFSAKIMNTTNIYADWIENPVKRQYTITALAGEGGSISPRGSVIVEEGHNQEFLIVPDEGYEILSVEVDGIKREAKGSFTFTNVAADHNIKASFVKKSSGEIQPPTEPETLTQPEPPTEPEQPTEPEPPTEPEQPTEPEPPTEPETPTEPESPTEPERPTTPETPDDWDSVDEPEPPADTGSMNPGSAGGTKDREPVTSGLSYVNMYATIAMIAGISYLLLYFVEKKRGMSEEKKNKMVSSLIAWGKSGAGSQRALKRAVAFICIVLILVYYHAIGKKLSLEWENLYEN